MTKQEIIGLIEENVGKKTDRSAYNDKESDKNGVGSNQFRRLSEMCKRAECVEEIELLVAYKMAKSGRDKFGGKEWNKAPAGKISPGQAVLNSIKIICEKETDEKARLRDLELFFGYMYWNARIWSSGIDTVNSDKAGGSRA
jgi:hypothetical protein